MRKTKIVNQKGFLLVETLIVSVFIMGIFSLLFTNIVPLIGEYERYKNYNTVEATYIAHWARMIALKGLPTDIYTKTASIGYIDISDCNLYQENNSSTICQNFKDVNNITKLYLTTYNTVEFKKYIKDNNSFSRDFKEYIDYLPTYSKNTNKTSSKGYYRVIIEYKANNTNKYGTMEVAL